MISILSSMIFTPIIGILFLMTIRGDENRIFRNSRSVRLIINFSEVLLCIFLLKSFNIDDSSFQFIDINLWIEPFSYHIGLNGISILLITVIILIFFLSCVIDWNNRIKLSREYMILLLWLESMIIGFISSLDIFLFVFCFSGIFVPFFFLFGIWDQRKEEGKNILILLMQSVSIGLVVLGMIMIYLNHYDTSLVSILEEGNKYKLANKEFIFWCLFVSFTLSIFSSLSTINKISNTVPISIIINTLIISILAGFYGFYKILLPLFSEQLISYGNVILSICLLGFLYFSFKAYSQNDLRKTIYSFSGSLLCIILSSFCSLSNLSISGSFYLLLHYFFVLSGLLICIDIIYRYRNSYHLTDYGGLLSQAPFFSRIFLLFILSSFCVPLSGGFIGFFMILLGFSNKFPIFSLFFTLSIVIISSYMLRSYWYICLGKPEEGSSFLRLSIREKSILVFYLGIIFSFGIFSNFFMPFIFPVFNQVGGLL